jgi:hypothetical protein
VPQPPTPPELLELAHQTIDDPEGLDEYVHDVASAQASDVNNGGLVAQLNFLVEHLGVEHTRKLLADHRR